jgi:hypothetical protein
MFGIVGTWNVNTTGSNALDMAQQYLVSIPFCGYCSNKSLGRNQFEKECRINAGEAFSLCAEVGVGSFMFKSSFASYAVIFQFLVLKVLLKLCE